MKFEYFIGVDISKSTFDLAYCHLSNPEKMTHKVFSNNEKGFVQMKLWLTEIKKIDLRLAFFSMEHTGVYVLELCTFLDRNCHSYSLENPLEIKRSIGIQRGKNDKADAQRIAMFLFYRRHQLVAKRLPSQDILKLKNLLAFRNRAVKSKAVLQKSMHDLIHSNHLINNDLLIELSKKQLTLLTTQIKEIERELYVVLQSDKSISRNFNLVTSVTGIGLITGIAFIVYTQNFASFTSARKFASYSGVAPYEHTSGISLKGKNRVSSLANKRMKALLSNGACTAIQHDPELKSYYKRKQAEGKANPVVLNAVKAKLISRVFAVVRKQSEFVKQPKYQLVA